MKLTKQERREEYLQAAERVLCEGAEGVFCATSLRLSVEEAVELEQVTGDALRPLWDLPADVRAMLLILAATI